MTVHDWLACQTLIDSDAILQSLCLSAQMLPRSRADTDDYSGRCGSSCRGESDIIGQRRRRYLNIPEPSGARKNQRQTRYRYCIQHGVTRKTVSSKSALYINHDSHQVPVSIVLTLASLMLCALAWVTDLPEALLITSSSIRKLPDTAAITLLPVRFFDAVNACHAPGAILHPLVMIATPHAVPGLRHHRRIQPIDEAA